MDQEMLTKQWKQAIVLLSIFLLAQIILYYPTYQSMVSLWIRSETFTHGFIILPICGWLIWRIRREVAATSPQVNFLGVPILIGLGLVWLLANYLGILAIEQLAATMMIPVLVFTLLGWQTCSVMAFPLLFILFAVPIGEELTPLLINFTADFTVTLVEMTGIPVYREGTYFQLPSGSWSVVAACSGVRYLIASVTLGALYAYLNYHSFRKRAVFIVASFVVPIIANGLRAYMIVMIGHYSDMELATGVDHLIYGWLFFGIVIAIMFYLGSFWCDRPESMSRRVISWRLGNVIYGHSPYAWVVVSLTLALVFWPVKHQFESQALDLDSVANLAIGSPDGWTKVATDPNAWRPAYQGLDRALLTTYQNSEGEQVNLFVGYYAKQRQGAELDGYNNVLVAEKDLLWRAIPAGSITLSAIGLKASTAVIKDNSNQYLTSYFFYVDGQWVAKKYQTKLLQAKSLLLGGRDDGAIVAITTKLEEGDDAASEILSHFFVTALVDIEQGLERMQVE